MGWAYAKRFTTVTGVRPERPVVKRIHPRAQNFPMGQWGVPLKNRMASLTNSTNASLR